MKALTIAELVAMTDVPSATIHYYLRGGLLPQPKRVASNRFLYDERHVQGLKLIRVLRDRRGLPLPMIRRILPDLLRLETEEAFSPEIWDRALAPRLSRRQAPSARLLDVAKDAFSRRGYADVNVDELCRAAHVAKGSFYRHYRSKEELFFAVSESLAGDIARAFAERAGAGGLEPSSAGALVAELLEQRLPLFLELTARALQHRVGYERCLDRIVAASAGHIGARITGEGTAEERGVRAIGMAVMALFRQGLSAGPEATFAGREHPL
jgi:AcrR family transcriptional regulator